MQLTHREGRTSDRSERSDSPFSDSASGFSSGWLVAVLAEELIELNTGMNDGIRMVGMFASTITLEILTPRHSHSRTTNKLKVK